MPEQTKTTSAETDATKDPAAVAKAAVLSGGVPGPPLAPGQSPSPAAQAASAATAQTAAEVEARVKTERQHPHLRRKPLKIDARAGSVFTIEGEDFGNGGSVLVGGLPATVTKWSDTNIKGSMPPNVERGEFVVFTAGGEQRGVWPSVATPAGASNVVRNDDGTIVVDGVRYRKEA